MSDGIPTRPLCTGVRVDRGGLPRHTMREQFYNREPMLVEQLWNAIAQAESGTDFQPTIRPSASPTGLGRP